LSLLAELTLVEGQSGKHRGEREGALCSHSLLVSACKLNIKEKGRGPKEQWKEVKAAFRLVYSFFAEALKKEDKVEQGEMERKKCPLERGCAFIIVLLLRAEMKGKGKVKSENEERRLFFVPPCRITEWQGLAVSRATRKDEILLKQIVVSRDSSQQQGQGGEKRRFAVFL
jgi:hypothetical protein